MAAPKQTEFRPLTREALEEMSQGLAERRRASGRNGSDRAASGTEEDDAPPPSSPDPLWSEGETVSRYLVQFPERLAGTPLEEVDPFYYGHGSGALTFVVVSKDRTIFRFSATPALLLLGPFHFLRRLALRVLTHKLFALLVFFTVVTNCVVLLLPEKEYMRSLEIFFISVYTSAAAVNFLARGLVLAEFTYLRDGWRRLELFVAAMAYVSFFLPDAVGRLSALRFLLLFPLPGFRPVASAILYSVRNLRDLALFTVFLLGGYAVLGLHLYMGVLTQTCVLKRPELDATPWESWTTNRSHWFGTGDEGYPICGNASGAGNCPGGYVCLKGVGDNPDYGYTSFDNIGYAYLSAFRLCTQDSWESLYQATVRATGPASVLFFMLHIFIGSYYIVNLALAIIAMSYDELQRQAEEMAVRELKALEAIRAAEEAALAKAMAAVSELEAALDLGGFQVEEEEEEKEDRNPDSQGLSRQRDDEDDKDDDYEGPNCRASLASNAAIVANILCFWDCAGLWIRFSELCSAVIFDAFTELFLLVCIVLNILLMALDHYKLEYGGMHPDFEEALYYGNTFFTIVFVIEALIKIAAMSPRYYFVDFWNVVDFAVAFLTLGELVFEGHAFLREVRIVRILRAFKLARYWKVLNTTLRVLLVTLQALTSVIVLLVVIVLIFALAGEEIFGPLYREGVCNDEWRCEMPVWNFTDVWHSALLVFRALCGEWVEPMWECSVVAGPWKCIPFFLFMVFVGNFVMLNLFLALVLSSFGGLYDNDGDDPLFDDGRDEIQIIADRFKRILRCCLCRKAQVTAVDDEKDGEDQVVDGDDDDLDGVSVDTANEAAAAAAASFPSLRLNTNGDAKETFLNNYGGPGDFELKTSSTPEALPEPDTKADHVEKDSIMNWSLKDLMGEMEMKSVSVKNEMPSSNNADSNVCNLTLDDIDAENSGYHQQVSERSTLRLSRDKEWEVDGDVGGAGNWDDQSLEDKEEEHVSLDRVSESVVDDDLPTMSGALAEPEAKSDQVEEDSTMNWSLKNLTGEKEADSISAKNEALSDDDADGNVNNMTLDDIDAENPSYRQQTSERSSLRLSRDEEREVGGDAGGTGSGGEPSLAEEGKMRISLDRVGGSEAEDDLPPRCCPRPFYKRFPCCGGDWVLWTRSRALTRRLIESKYFKVLIILIILVSTVALAFEDIWIDTRPRLKEVLSYLEIAFAVCFTAEMLLKLHAMGFAEYFSSGWCLLEFSVVVVSLATLAFEVVKIGDGAFRPSRSLSALRALRLFRIAAEIERTNAIVNALFGSAPSVLNVFVMCLLLWLLFAIVGMNLLMGRFHKCVRPSTGRRWDHGVVPNRTACQLEADGGGGDALWENSKINFDNVFSSYWALFMLATWEGWLEIIADGVDSVELGGQPHREANPFMYVYFVAYISFGSFFTLNLILGAVVDLYYKYKSNYRDDGDVGAFCTDEQKQYLKAMRKGLARRPARVQRRPGTGLRAAVFRLVAHKGSDLVMTGVIVLNMVVLMCHHYRQSGGWTSVLDGLNSLFVAVYVVEAALKAFALRGRYLRDPWNVFDLVVLLAAVADIAFQEVFVEYFVPPLLLKMVRLVRIAQILRPVKPAKGIRVMAFALRASLPDLANVVLLICLLAVFFSLVGMTQFKNVRIDYGFDDVFNFQTFLRTFMLLFQIATGASWNEVWLAISNEDGCDEDRGDCGRMIGSVVFMILYIVPTMLILVNMYIGIMLQAYSEAIEQVQEGITEEDYELFYEVWQEYDPQATGYVDLGRLPELLEALDPPLAVPAPNRLKIVLLDVPIVKYTSPDTGEEVEDCVFYGDVVDAVTRNFFTKKYELWEEEELRIEKPDTGEGGPAHERTSSSWERQREAYLASLVHFAHRWYRSNGGDGGGHGDDNGDGDGDDGDGVRVRKGGDDPLPPIDLLPSPPPARRNFS